MAATNWISVTFVNIMFMKWLLQEASFDGKEKVFAPKPLYIPQLKPHFEDQKFTGRLPMKRLVGSYSYPRDSLRNR